MAFKLPKFTYPAYQYARHLEIMFQIDDTDLDDHQLFLLFFAELLKRLPTKVNSIFNSDDLKEFTLRRVINLLRKYDGPTNIILEHSATEASILIMPLPERLVELPTLVLEVRETVNVEKELFKNDDGIKLQIEQFANENYEYQNYETVEILPWSVGICYEQLIGQYYYTAMTTCHVNQSLLEKEYYAFENIEVLQIMKENNWNCTYHSVTNSSSHVNYISILYYFNFSIILFCHLHVILPIISSLFLSLKRIFFFPDWLLYYLICCLDHHDLVIY